MCTYAWCAGALFPGPGGALALLVAQAQCSHGGFSSTDEVDLNFLIPLPGCELLLTCRMKWYLWPKWQQGLLSSPQTPDHQAEVPHWGVNKNQ